MRWIRRDILAAVASAMTLGSLAAPQLAHAAGADGYPNKLVKLVIPYTPGAHADLLARTLAGKLSDMWKQPVIVENRPGGGGTIGTTVGAKSAPDGYTLLMSALGQLVIFPAMQTVPPYNVITDFDPVIPLVRTPWVLYINKDVPANNVREFIAYAKAQPQGVNAATTGVGTSQHLANEIFMRTAGFKGENIHYPGSAAALQDLMAGRDQFLFDSLLTQKYVADGRLKALAISSTKRSPFAPDLPTMEEAGVPGFDVQVWFGLFFPAKTPADIVAKVNADVKTAMSSKEVQDQLKVANFDYIYDSTPAQFADMVKRENDKWGKIVRDLGIKSE